MLQTDRLKMVEREVEELKAQLERNKKEAHQAEEQYKEATHHWQTKVQSFPTSLTFIIQESKL